jgi:hypothetical protein
VCILCTLCIIYYELLCINCDYESDLMYFKLYLLIFYSLSIVELLFLLVDIFCD